MDFNELPQELQEKARACTTSEELLALAKEEGLELDEKQLEGLSGGWDPDVDKKNSTHTTLCESLKRK